MSDDDKAGWPEYQRLVLSELERLHQELKDLKEHVMSNMPNRADYDRLERDIEALQKEVNEQGKNLTALNVKSAMLGAGAGLVVSILGLIFKIMAG